MPQLQIRAQRAVASFYAGTFGTAGAAWSSWFIAGWIDAEVALAFGLVGVVGSLRWLLIRRWEKAQRKFLEGWSRVGNGLERDLKSEQEQIIPVVTQKAVAAVEGLEGLVAKRTQAIDAVTAEHTKVFDSLQNIRRTLSQSSV